MTGQGTLAPSCCPTQCYSAVFQRRFMSDLGEGNRPRPNWIRFAILVAIFSGVCVAQGKLSASKLSQIDAVTKFMASTHVPGLSVAVVEDGEYEWAQGFGFADLENNAPASKHTLFRLGSISKSLTCHGCHATVGSRTARSGRLYKNTVLHFLKSRGPSRLAKCSDTLAGFATTSPTRRTIQRSATRNTLMILSPDGSLSTRRPCGANSRTILSRQHSR